MGFGLEFLIVLLLPLGVLAAIVIVVVALFRRAGDRTDLDDPGIGSLKRLYYYLLGFAALAVASAGVTLLVRGLLEVIAGERVIAGGEAELALALALTLVGTPLWLYLWSLAQRSLREHPVEAGTLGRKLYVYLVLGWAAGIAAGGLVSLLMNVFSTDDDFSPGQLALPLVMGGVWWFHWRSEAVEGQPTEAALLVRRLYVYITGAYGLALLAIGGGLILAGVFTSAYDALVGTLLVSPGGAPIWNPDVRAGAPMAIVGAIWWWWHWLRVADADEQSAPRQIYLYLYTVLGGAVTVVVSFSVAMDGLLLWVMGAADVSAAAVHFRFLPADLAGLAVGGGLWGYHAAVIHQETGVLDGGQTAARRVYRYLVAALGLGVMAAGLVLLIGVAVGTLAPQTGDTLAGRDWWKQPMSWSLTLTLVGALIWGFYWWVIQRTVAVSPPAGADEERDSQSRRTFIYGVFGAAVLIVLGNLSALLFVVFRDLLEGELGASALQGGKWSIGALLMAGAIGVYHWLIARQDREAGAGKPREAVARPRRKSVTVAAGAADPVRRIEARLGYRVRWWRTTDAAEASGLPEADVDGLAEQINAAPGDNVLVMVDASGARVLPYEPS